MEEVKTLEVPASEEKVTPPASSTEQKTDSEPTPNASEGAKTPEKDELRFDQHSRFKELVEAKNAAEARATELETKLASLTPAQNAAVMQEASKATGVATEDMPKFDTLEDLVKWAATLPQKIKQDLVREQTVAKEAEVREQIEIDRVVQSQLAEVKGEMELKGEKYTDEFKKDFAQFCEEYDQTDLVKAYKLFSQINATKSEALKKGEAIGKRKADSGVKSEKSTGEQKMSYRRGQSLDQIIAEAKHNAPKG